MPERDELDRLIDSALGDYAEPRAGLEQRMLARVAGDAARPSRRLWILAAFAVPAALVLLLVSYLVPWNLHQQPGRMAYTPAAPKVATPVVTAPEQPTSRRALPSRHIRAREVSDDRAASNPVPRPKLDVFPTPQPLTGEEQALVRFVTQTAEPDRKALIAAEQQVDEPLNISAIRIPPLQLTDENQH